MAKLEDVIRRGTNAARPDATTVAVGTLYYDTTNSSLGRSTGAAWESVEGSGGLADQGTITYLDASEAAAPATPAANKVRFYAKADGLLYSKDDAGVETVVTGGAGGGGVVSPFWWHSDNAPGSPNAANREFTAALTDTRVSHGTPKGTWAVADDGAEFTQTVTGATDLDVWAIARTCSIGDYATILGWAPFHGVLLGMFVGFADGTTFGTSNAVGTSHHFSAGSQTVLLNTWGGFNSRTLDGTNFTGPAIGIEFGMRVKYEAANTWGLYIRQPGGGWRAVQTNYASTMTPTHVVFGVNMTNSPAFTAGNGVRLECFRVND